MGAGATPLGSRGPASKIDPRALLDGMPGVVAVVDASGEVVWVNDSMADLTGYSREELIGSNMLDHLDLEWNPLGLESIDYALSNPGMRLPTMLRFHARDGRSVVMEVTANNQLDNPEVRGLICHLRPSDERQLLDHILESFAAGEDLESTMSRLHAAAASETLRSECAVVLMRPGTAEQRTVLASTPDVEAMTSTPGLATPWAQAALLAQPVLVPDAADLVAPLDDQAAGSGLQACWAYPLARSTAGTADAVLVFWRREAGPPEPSATMVAGRLVRTCELVLERVEHSRQLQHAATHDPLTGLLNRSAFFDVLDDHLVTAPGTTGVVYLDLDGFKPINDRWGHGHGDRVLRAVADRLCSTAGPADAVARLGGDEFAICCPQTDERALVGLAERILIVLRAPITLDQAIVRVGASIGLAVCPADACSGDVLVASADSALLHVKAGAKGTWELGAIAPAS